MLAAILFLVASFSLPGFFTPDNLVSIVRSVSVLGILALGMAIVIIGRGIDLSAVAIMAMSVAWYLQLLNDGSGETLAFAYTIAFVFCIGLINGFLVAYADVPAIFVTLASGSFVFGYVRSQLITQDAVPVPPGTGSSAGAAPPSRRAGRSVHLPPSAFLMFLFLRYTKWGRYVYLCRRQSGRRPQYGHPGTADAVLRYVISALMAFIAGLLTASSLHSINTRVVNSSCSTTSCWSWSSAASGLAGGKGGVRNVLVRRALIGILLNAMTIIDIPLLYQNLIKAAILLARHRRRRLRQSRATSRPPSRETSELPRPMFRPRDRTRNKSATERHDMKHFFKTLLAAAAAFSFSAYAGLSVAAEDPGPAAYAQALKGKRIMLVPMAMGFDLAQGWAAYLKKEVDAWGGVFETRDPNWSVDAGAQAITEAIRRTQARTC